MNRRDFLKNFSIMAAGVLIAPKFAISGSEELEAKKELAFSEIRIDDIIVAVKDSDPVTQCSFYCTAIEPEFKFIPLELEDQNESIYDYDILLILKRHQSEPDNKYSHYERRHSYPIIHLNKNDRPKNS